MRNFFAMLMTLCLLVLSASAQDVQFEVKKSKAGDFGMSTATLVEGETVTVEGKVFDVHITTGGSRFVKCLSEHGNAYPMWIGESTGYMFEGHRVRVYDSGTHFILLLSKKSGWPYRKWLTKK